MYEELIGRVLLGDPETGDGLDPDTAANLCALHMAVCEQITCNGLGRHRAKSCGGRILDTRQSVLIEHNETKATSVVCGECFDLIVGIARKQRPDILDAFTVTDARQHADLLDSLDWAKGT